MTGGCPCGAVRYCVEGPLDPVVAYHCSQCRRSSGHFQALTGALREQVVMEGPVARYESTPGEVRRGFRPVCGSNLFWDRTDEETVDLWVGTLDAPAGLRLAYHVHVADKPDYDAIADGLPQHPRERTP